ncbi:hypothetical protein BY996DRAFT_2208012 [Phakopsora pachyrhizi]|nr:hypothetical protein BY996DRAFT_2208012 [Phakopsora pachyrhizi]
MNYDGIETEGPNDDLESSIHASDFFDSDPDPSTSGGLAASAYELVESSDLSSDDSGSPLSLETEISSSEDDSDRAWSNSPSPAGNQTHHPLDVNNLFSDLHQDDLIPNTIEEQDAYIDETSHRFLDPAQGFCIDHIQDDSNHEGLPSPGSQPVSSFLDSDSSLASIASLSYSFPDPTKSCDQSIECNLSRQLSPAVTTESEGNDEERGKLGWNLEDKSSLSDDDHLTDFKDQQTNHKFRTATELDQSNLKLEHRFSPNMEIYDRLIGTLEEPSSTRALLKPCTIKDLGRISKVCDTKLRNLTVISKRQGSPGDSRRSRDSYPLIGIVCLFVSLATWIFFKTECFQMKTNSQKIVSSSGSPGGHPKLPFPIDSSSKIGSEIQHGATLKPVNEVYPSKHESSKIKNEAKSLSLDLAESSVRKNAPGQFIKSPLLKDVSIYVQRAKKRMSSDSRSFEESQRKLP